MSLALDQLLDRLLAGRTATDPASARVSVLGGGVAISVAVNGLAVRLLHVTPSTATELPFVAKERLVLRIVLGDDGTRIDVPVEVAACGRRAIVLRMVGAPLVLRRRMIRDRALEEALDVRAPGQPELVA